MLLKNRLELDLCFQLEITASAFFQTRLSRRLILIYQRVFLASQDALEVMLVSESVSESLTLRTELTDVTLVSEDTY